MPNWCSHTATISHDDPAMITELVDSFAEEKTFEHLIPFPDGKWDYDWCSQNWGTKWDINSPQCSFDGPTTLEVTFMTAWSPPIPVFERMKQLGYTVKAEYWDEGGFFVGVWNDGESLVFDPDNAPPELAHLVANFSPEPDEYGDTTTEDDTP